MPHGEDSDRYAQGMVFSTGEQEGLTPELDRFQFEIFHQYLGRRIIEVGAGAGRMTELIRLNSDHDEFVAMEPSDHFFGLLRRRYVAESSPRVIQAITSEVVEQYREHFDTVLSVHVMEHVEDDRSFLTDCLAMTKSGGRVIIQVPACQFLYSNLDRNIGHYRRYDKKMARLLMSGLDVQVERLQYNNFIGVLASAWFIKFRKLDYQTSESSRGRFFRLYAIYSKRVIPVVRAAEKVITPPIGLNLTIVVRKR